LTSVTLNSFISNVGLGFFGVNNANMSWTFDYIGAIPDGVCNGKSGVTSVTIGNQITSIGSHAFHNCSSLTSVTIPDSVTSIGSNAFGLSGLTEVVISGINGLNLTSPATNVTFYGTTVSFILPVLISEICFPGNTPIKTDQGKILIKDLKENEHTIDGKRIVCVTRTVTNEKYLTCLEKDSLGENIPSKRTIMSGRHKLLYKGKIIESKSLVGKLENVKKIKYGGEVLYNVLMESHYQIMVNNLICETLDPSCDIAIIHMLLLKLTNSNKIKLIKKCNEGKMKRIDMMNRIRRLV